MPPEIPSVQLVHAALERGRKRLWVRDLLHALTAGALIAAAGFLFAPVSTRWTIGLLALAVAATAGLVWRRRRARTTRSVAILIERGDPSLKNLIVTAEELIRHPGRSAEWIRSRIFDEASGRLTAIDHRATVPLGRAVLATLAAIVIAASAPLLVRSSRSDEGTMSMQTPAAGPAGALVLEARIDPPAYSKRGAAVLTNPGRIDALAGSRLTLVAGPKSAAATVRFGDRPLPGSTREDGVHFELELAESGYLAVEAGTAEPTRLIAVTVSPDRAPTVRVERPGRDLMLPTVNHMIDIDAAASDDIGLGSLALRYTRVSGSGEQFEFAEGELPLAINRENAQNWRAHGRIPVAALGLEPGDSLVYRLTARDGRPGTAGTASSDTFFVEIAGPGQVALEGFEMPPDQERYALSQQMIVVKLRRLRDRERRLSAQALDDETGAIAAEQRAVRSNFVFLMGGHVEDEEEEAEHSNEIQEGRLENTARREIWRAVAFMTTVEQALAGRDTGGALTAAVKAVDALQRAFTRNRYILRTLPSRLRIDPSRRLSGDLDEARDGSRAVAPATEAASVVLSRQVLADMIALIPALRASPRSPQAVMTLSAAAERALAAAPGERQWSAIAEAILRLRGSVSDNADISRIDDEARAVVQALLERMRPDSATVRGGGANRLESAWAAEGLRR